MDHEPVPDAERSGDNQLPWRAQRQAMRLLRRRAPAPEPASSEGIADAMAAFGVPPIDQVVGATIHLAGVEDVERLADVVRRTREHELELDRIRDEHAYVRSTRRLALVLGWTAYLLLVATFVTTLTLAVVAARTDMERLPVPLGGTVASGLLLFGWTWRYIMRTADPQASELRRESLGERVASHIRQQKDDSQPRDGRD